MIESVVNGVGGQFSHLERQQHARGIDRIEKTVSVADDDKSVTGVVFGTIRVVEDRVDLIDARALGNAPPDRFTLLDLFVKNLRQVLPAAFQKIIGIGTMPTLVMSFSSGIYQNQPPLPGSVRSTSVAPPFRSGSRCASLK